MTTPAQNRSDVVYAWYVVLVLLLAQAFAFLDRMIMGLLVGPIRASFEISDTQFSLLAGCLLYTSPSPRDVEESRMPSSA